MKLGVMSDSHDNIPNVKRAVEVFNDIGVDLVVHAGDFIAPFAIDPLADLNCRVVGVFGNNDGERVVVAKRFEAIGGEVHPNLASASLGDLSIAVMHYPELAIPIAKSGDYDIVIYGHTHKVDVQSIPVYTNEGTDWYPGAKLKEFREEAGLSKVNVTLQLGMSKNSSAAIGDWEDRCLKVPVKHRENLLALYRKHGIKIEDYKKKENSLLLNPGETGGWTTGKATVAVVDIETLEATIYEI